MSPKTSWDPRRRPPEHLIEKSPIYRYQLSEPESDDQVVLLQQMALYNQRIYWFCLTLAVVENEQDLHIERVDTCHSFVHRHRLSASDAEEEKIHICNFEPGDHMLLETEHDRAFDNYMSSWPQRVAEWRRR